MKILLFKKNIKLANIINFNLLKEQTSYEQILSFVCNQMFDYLFFNEYIHIKVIWNKKLLLKNT